MNETTVGRVSNNKPTFLSVVYNKLNVSKQQR